MFVLNQLITKGQVSRNTCLDNRISRLGSIMCIFKENGLKYEAGYKDQIDGKDYVYTILKGQKRKLKNLVNIFG